MSSDLVDIFLLGLVSTFNPSLLAAVTVMLLLPNPKRLMLGYLLGAYMQLLPTRRWCSRSTTTSSASDTTATATSWRRWPPTLSPSRTASPAIGEFRLIGADEERLPLVAFQLEGEHDYDEFDLASQLSADRGWMVPAYTLPPNADHVKMMRALVKLTLGHTLATTLADDMAQACKVLAEKGRLHEHDRARVKTGTGY